MQIKVKKQKEDNLLESNGENVEHDGLFYVGRVMVKGNKKKIIIKKALWGAGPSKVDKD